MFSLHSAVWPSTLGEATSPARPGNPLGTHNRTQADNEAAAEDDDGEFPMNLSRKWSRLKTCPQPTEGFILMKSSRFI